MFNLNIWQNGLLQNFWASPSPDCCKVLKASSLHKGTCAYRCLESLKPWNKDLGALLDHAELPVWHKRLPFREAVNVRSIWNYSWICQLRVVPYILNDSFNPVAGVSVRIPNYSSQIICHDVTNMLRTQLNSYHREMNHRTVPRKVRWTQIHRSHLARPKGKVALKYFDIAGEPKQPRPGWSTRGSSIPKAGIIQKKMGNDQ